MSLQMRPACERCGSALEDGGVLLEEPFGFGTLAGLGIVVLITGIAPGKR